MHAWKSIPGSTDSTRKKPEAEKAIVYSSYGGLKEQRSRRRIYHILIVAMSFKREGDDWSQLNVLKVSPSESHLITFSRPVALFCCFGDI